MSKTAFLFPGQASQFVGMGQDIYNKCTIAPKYYNLAEEVFDFSLKELSFFGPIKELTQTKVTQPAIFVHSIAMFEELKNKGFQPDMVAGHSLGEYSALVAAETLAFEQGLQLVKLRAEQMQAATENNAGSMAAIVGLNIKKIRKVLEKSEKSGICKIANHNSPNQIVISGETPAVQSAMLELKKAGARLAIELTVGGAFHSPLMEKAKEKLINALNSTQFQIPKYPIYSNVSGTATVNPTEIKLRLCDQLTSPVLWVDTITNMISDGATNFIEVGPNKILQGLVKRIDKKIQIKGVSSFKDLERF